MRPAATWTVSVNGPPSHAALQRVTYLAAADYKNALIANLPCENERSAALDLWIGAGHVVVNVVGEEASITEIAKTQLSSVALGRYR